MNSSTTPPDRPTRIVQAATLLFARQGYHGTSTREIARLAEISENTLFRYFEHKEDLFSEALRSALSGLQLRKPLQVAIRENAPLEVVLPQVLAQLLDTNILKPELARLIAVGLIELNWKSQAVCYEYLSPMFSAVSRYLAVNIEGGKVRNLSPSMVMASLTAMVLVYPQFAKLIAGAEPPYDSDSQRAVETYTRFWLNVLVPSEAPRVSV